MQTPAEQHFHRIEEAVSHAAAGHAVRDLRIILESIFRHLTSADRRSFAGSYARMEFIFDRMNVGQGLREQIHGLWKHGTHHLIHELRDDRDTYLLGLRAVCEAVAFFYATTIPAALQVQYASLGERRFTYSPVSGSETLPVMRPVVTAIGQVEEQDGRRHFSIVCRDRELGVFTLRLWQSPGGDLTRLQRLMRPYQTLHVLHCRKIEGTDDRYASTSRTQVVIEPDILLDVSSLAGCFQQRVIQPLAFFTSQFIPSEMNDKAFTGVMVNAMLDEAVRTPVPDFVKAYREAVADNVLKAASLGKEMLREIYGNIRRMHWSNLLRMAEDVRNLPTRIEPTFYSAQYGLQGRLDLLVEDPSDAARKDIVELKSGGYPRSGGAWKNHEMQVVGYNLLLRSTFGEHRTGNSSILYSSAPADALRNVTSDTLSENELLELRNTVVAGLLQLADGDHALLARIDEHSAEGCPPYTTEEFIRYGSYYSAADPLKRAYYHSFLSFVIREFLNEKCGMASAPSRDDQGDGFAALWLQDEEDKACNFVILRGLEYGSFDDAKSFVHFQMPGAQNHNFREGDPVLIYARTDEGLNPLCQQILKGRLDSLGQGTVAVSLNNRQLDASHFERHVEWVVEHDVFDNNHWQMARALFSMLDPAHDARFWLIAGLTTPVAGEIPQISAEGFNENQKNILQKAIAAKDYFLVQGPPGTGKTSTFLTGLVNELLQADGSIVVVAFTNRAVDEIGQRLRDKGISFLQLGSRKSEAEAELRAIVEKGDIESAAQFIKGHRVFLSTVSTMNNRLPGLKDLKSDLRTLVVDEASQLNEPQLISLLLAFEKFILIGDQNQLPPVVTQDPVFTETTDPLLNGIGIDNLRSSIFDRLMRNAKQRSWDHAWGMLTTHYRMHEDIAALIDAWYGHQLICGKPAQQASHVFEGPEDAHGWHRVLGAARTVLVPSPVEKTGKFHDTEARRIVSLLRYIRATMGSSFHDGTVGVVTPWRTQIGLIRSLIGDDEDLKAVSIETVERFQGSEKDIILVSFAIYHPGQLEMLKSPGRFGFTSPSGVAGEVDMDRKLLVTLSRAKQQVIVFGDEHVILADWLWGDVIGKMTVVRVD
jgi:DNA replication ATP-dependent helicase Dna2